jgi:peptidoglycan/xylan/chitin deacetylase (PgdA/CDA1 family)
VISKVVKEGFNPYNGISELMDVEKAVGVRSTFFFRPEYDDGVLVEAYEEAIKALVEGGWEIAVHINDASTLLSILREKKAVEKVAGKTCGSRVQDASLFEAAGFSYDSSSMFCRDAIDKRNMGFFRHDGLIVFPITIMDTYLFSYMRVSEENVVANLEKAANLAVEKGFMTIVWHDCSLKMKGGRMYPKVLKTLVSRENTNLVRGIDAYNLVQGAEKS